MLVIESNLVTLLFDRIAMSDTLTPLNINSLDTTLQFQGISIRSERYKPTEHQQAEDSFKLIQAAFDDLNAGKWEQSLEQLKRLVIYFPEQPRLFLYKGLAEANLAKFDQAAESLKWFLVKDPGNQEGLKLLAKVEELQLQVQGLPRVEAQAEKLPFLLAKHLQSGNKAD